MAVNYFNDFSMGDVNQLKIFKKLIFCCWKGGGGGGGNVEEKGNWLRHNRGTFFHTDEDNY